MRKIIASFITLALLAPAAASAQSATDLQAQAAALLQQIQVLQAQLAAQGGAQGSGVVNVGTGGVVPVAGSAGVNSSACPNIGRALKAGSSGDDVTRLQQFLAGDASIYPEGRVTGYYGGLTVAAVQRWQAKYQIVSSGTPDTTGYGVVGPRTAAAIALLCSTGAGVSGKAAAVGGYIQVSPISGNAPLRVNVQATVNTINSCVAAQYSLDWGDNTAPTQIPVSAGTCSQVNQTYQHVYNYGGTFQITLSAGAHRTSATVSVTGPAAPGGPTGSGTPVSGTLPAESFNAAPTSGAAPLSVVFTGVVTSADAGWCAAGCSSVLAFGDGTTGLVPLPTSQGTYQNYSITHTYQSAGTYQAILYQGGVAAGRPTVGSATITVGGGSAASYGPLLITPGSARSVTLSFDLPACGSYSVNWGDSTPTVATASSCTSGGSATTPSLSHTYAGNGSYTITVTRNTRTDTAGVNITN